MALDRWLAASLDDAIGGFRLVVVGGARQAGKSTLLRQRAAADGWRYVTFDDPATLALARADPTGFVADVTPTTVIDEFQRAGDPFLLALKHRVDLDPVKGLAVLAGSADFLTSSRLSETLAGRVGLVTLWPLSQGEIAERREGFLDRFLSDPAAVSASSRSELLDRRAYADLIVRGGFPDAVAAPSPRVRGAWFDSYVETVLARESTQDAAEVRNPLALRRVFEVALARSAGELVVADVARDAGIAPATADAYLGVLRTIFQLHLVPAWASAAASRAKRHPKVHPVDVGVAAHVLGHDAASLAALGCREFGPLLEAFVVGELARQAGWSSSRHRLSHFRDRDGGEVDVVVELPRGRILGIEVKGAASVGGDDARHLTRLRSRLGDAFVGGVVFHVGATAGSLGDRLWALPVSTLWS